MAIADYDTYTEIDDGTDNITIVSSQQIDFVDLTRNEKSYVYFDYGLNSFPGDFEHLFSGKLTSGLNGFAYIWGLNANVGSWDTVFATGVGFRFQLTGSDNYFTLIGEIFDTWEGFVFGVRYYFTAKRVGSTFTLYAYTDAARTSLVTSIGGTWTRSCQYHYAVFSHYTNHVRPMTGVLYDTDLQRVVGNINRKLGRGLGCGLGRGLA